MTYYPKDFFFQLILISVRVSVGNKFFTVGKEHDLLQYFHYGLHQKFLQYFHCSLHQKLENPKGLNNGNHKVSILIISMYPKYLSGNLNTLVIMFE